MLDRAKPTPTDQAVEIIERSLAAAERRVRSLRPGTDRRRVLATVYQAELKSGERGGECGGRIGPILSADLSARWLMIALRP